MKILLVEDDEKLGRLQKELLEIGGFEVVWAQNGKSALEEFTFSGHDNFDVIVLDWMLPEISGIEICKILRRKYNYQGGILFVTAKDGLDDCVAGLDSGADDYIVKPFENKELVARINAVSRRKSKPFVDNIYEREGFRINKNLLTVGFGTEELSLTRREFDIFYLLFVNAGQIIPRETLIEKVWADNFEVTDSSLDSYIYLLRRKLKFFGTMLNIKVVKNIGYYLEIKSHD